MAPIATLDQLLRDPHLERTGFFSRQTHPSEGEIRAAGIPVTFSRTPGSIRRLAPRLGEQGAKSDEIGEAQSSKGRRAAHGAVH